MDTATLPLSPVGDVVLVEPLEGLGAHERYADCTHHDPGYSGLIEIPANGHRTGYGVVRAAGPGAWTKKGERRPMNVKVGDTVFFGRHTGQQTVYESGGKRYLAMREAHIDGVVQ